MNRGERFVTSSVDLRARSDSAKNERSLPFFGGDNVKTRMDEVRAAIVQIRSGVHGYPQLSRDLQQRLEQERDQWLQTQTKRDLEKAEIDLRVLDNRLALLCGSSRDWIDRPGVAATASDAHEAVRVYTSGIGYVLFQSVAKKVFRQFPIPDPEEVLTATFLVELLTIDLYNYWWADRTNRSFEGIVYRGINMTADDFRDLSALVTTDLSQRYFSIPLGLDSSSRSKEEAGKFLCTDGSMVPVIQKIHVCGLPPDLERHYRQSYPQSVVSTICAVPLRDLSDFQDEDEVLLRGPFFQILRIGLETVRGIAVPTIEAVMLNSNRDHFSTPQTGADDSARRLFGTLVALRRNQFCAAFCRDHSMPADEETYLRLLDSKRVEFQRLTGSTSPV